MAKPPFDPSKPFEEAPTSKPAFDPMKPFDEVKAPQPTAGDRVQAAGEGFADTATLGYLPQLQALAGGLMPNPSADVDEKLKAEGFKIHQEEDSYVKRRDENVKRQKEFAEKMPLEFYGGGLLGVAASAPFMPGSAVKGAGLLGRAGSAAKMGAIQGTLMNPGDEEGEVNLLQLDKRAKNAAAGAAIGTAGQGIAETARGAVGAVTKAPGALKEYSQNKAFKSTGAMKKDFTRAFKKDRVKELGQEMIDSGLVKPGMTFDDVAQKSGSIKKQVGEKIGQIYDKVQGNFNFKVDPQKLGLDLVETVSNSKVRPNIDTAAYDAKMEGVIMDVLKQKDKLSDIRHLNDLIGEIDTKINYAKKTNELPAIQQGYTAVRRYLRDTLNDVVEKTGNLLENPKLGKELKELNRRYGNMTEINVISKDRVARESANQAFGLTDKIAGVGGLAGGAVTGALVTGDVEGALKGAALGSGLGLLNKASRTYGAPILATGANKLAQQFERIPGGLTQAVRRTAVPVARRPGLLGSNLPRLFQEKSNPVSRYAENETSKDRKPAKKDKK